jgi:hypothetical protein
MKIKIFFSIIYVAFIAESLFGNNNVNPPVTGHPTKKVLTITPTRDDTTVLHNPIMGFTTFFATFKGDWNYSPDRIFNDPRVMKYTNILYIRTNWTSMEPTEGSYVWENNQGFKTIIQAAVDKGFRVAFRIICQDGNGTPPYVINAIKAAGQNPYSTVVRGNSYADVTNPIWQQKFRKFILAFGAAFDNPAVTDYIDANGLGLWGEGNHSGVPLNQQESYYDWHLGVYNDAFKNVILNVNFSQYGVNKLDTDERIPFGKYGMLFRRDGLGSRWIKRGEIAFMQRHFPEIPLIGELCYDFYDVARWSSDSLIIAKSLPAAPSVRTYIDLILEQAFQLHANTLSFKEANVWTDQYPDLTAKVIANLGYRLRPVIITVPSQSGINDTMKISHKWTNDGVGVLPNGNIRWKNKYAIAFALFKSTDLNPTEVFIDSLANPGILVKGTETTYNTNIQWKVPAGNYWIAVGILDKTRPTAPSLDLAIKPLGRRNSWYLLNSITVKAN